METVAFVEGRFDARGARTTLSVDVSQSELALGEQSVSVQLYDTAGQERYAPLTAPYYRQVRAPCQAVPQ